MYKSINNEICSHLPEFISKLTIWSSKKNLDDHSKFSDPITFKQHCDNHMILPSKYVKIEIAMDHEDEDLISELRCYLHKKFKRVKFENNGNGLYSIFLQLENGLNELIIQHKNSKSPFRLILDAKSSCIRTICNVVISLITVMVLASTIAQISYIPSGSMMRTFIEGDYLLINKLSYFFKNPKVNDIIVFDFPYDPDRQFVKRIIALPNDKVKIDNGMVYVNDKLQIENFTINNYQIKSIQEIDIMAQNPKKTLLANSYLIYTNSTFDQQSYISKNIHDKQLQEIYLHNKKIEKQSIPLKVIGYELDTFATIQSKISNGITLDNQSKFYLISLEDLSKNTKDNTMKETVVSPNKYFVAGDNRNNSMDSRYWGFVSKDRIRGQPVMRFYPNFQIGFNSKEQK